MECIAYLASFFGGCLCGVLIAALCMVGRDSDFK